ncbi:D-aminoacyl-tRNA deacylase [subsurface metagenome]
MFRVCDSHCHLQDKKFSKDLERVINSAKEKGVKSIIVPGWDVNSSKYAMEIAEKYEEIYATIGIHPHDAKIYNDNIEKEISNLIRKEKVIAVGEIGLDYYRDLSPRDIQREVFKKQLKIAEDENLPVVIHTRNSLDEAIDIVKDFKVKGVFHAFTKEARIAKRIIDIGFYVGIGGVVTFKNSRLSNEIKYIPVENILLETDAPYIAPEPMRGKRNEPAYTIHILEKIAKVKSMPIEQVAEITYENTRELFKF